MAEAPGLVQRRIVIGAGLCVAAFTLVAIQLVNVTLIHPSGRAGAADKPLSARADLVDRNGELLARDLPVKDLYARPHVFWDKGEAARDLAGVSRGPKVRYCPSAMYEAAAKQRS